MRTPASSSHFSNFPSANRSLFGPFFSMSRNFLLKQIFKISLFSFPGRPPPLDQPVWSISLPSPFRRSGSSPPLSLNSPLCSAFSNPGVGHSSPETSLSCAKVSAWILEFPPLPYLELLSSFWTSSFSWDPC